MHTSHLSITSGGVPDRSVYKSITYNIAFTQVKGIPDPAKPASTRTSTNCLLQVMAIGAETNNLFMRDVLENSLRILILSASLCDQKHFLLTL